MESQNLAPILAVGQRHFNVDAEAPWPEQGGIDEVEPVGGGQRNHAGAGVERIQLAEQLAHNPFGRTAARFESPGGCHCVELVEEQ